ncbi:Nucleoside diphosphate-linked moiety X motif 19 [Balamuthia mandrillaris]
MKAGASSTPRLASTLLLAARCAPSSVLGGGCDYKLLMVKRAMKARFMPGVHVFPGGVLEESDKDPIWYALFERQRKVMPTSFSSSSSSLSTSSLALRVAAIRELFEETNVLLTHPPSTMLKEEGEGEQGRRRWRESVQKDAGQFARLFQQLSSGPRNHEDKGSLVLPDVHSLIPWSHWVTPAQERWRYDTYFYFAITESIPTRVMQDQSEVTSFDWFSPEEALRSFQEGTISLAPPTWLLLQELRCDYPTLSHFDSLLSSPYSSVDGRRAKNEEIRRSRDMSPIQPDIKQDEEGKVAICLPGDKDHHLTLEKQKKNETEGECAGSNTFRRIVLLKKNEFMFQNDNKKSEELLERKRMTEEEALAESVFLQLKHSAAL